MEERPIECGSCKRKACIVYKEMADGKVVSFRACSECPILKERLGTTAEESYAPVSDLPEGAYCPNCHTTSQSLLLGESLGCEKCYELFEDLIVDELTHSNLIPIQPESSLAKEKKMPLHLGSVSEKLHEDLSNKLESLNMALSEALKLENYERAASLRDQIKTLTKRSNPST